MNSLMQKRDSIMKQYIKLCHRGKKCFITELLIYICIIVIKGSLFNI